MTGSAVPSVPDALAALRDRLLALRADLVRQLAASDALDAGLLTLVGHVGAALDALDAAPADAALAERAVVTDDGEAIRLASYTGAARVAVVELDAARAVRLAGELIAAAVRRLQ